MSAENSTQPSKFYLTTPIYYVNARPHIGHAYTTIVADVLARRHRLLGEPTFFLTGTDEHGQKIERSAAAAGVPPQQFADEVSAAFRTLWNRMGLTFDRYIRTTDERHKRAVQHLVSSLYERGFIYLSQYTGQYSVGEEMFVEGPPGTIGPDGKPTETVTEENFFFKLSAFQRPLLNLIETGVLTIEPEARRNEVLSFLRGDVRAATDVTGATGLADGTADGNTADEARSAASESAANPEHLLAYTDMGHAYVPGALKDLSISRSSFTWGVPVPEPAASLASQKHVIYVWLDALANYMSAIGYGADLGSPEHAEFRKWWPADLHLVGKEIIRFHCVYWPAFLLAAGLPLPKAITAHGWLLFDNAKMSKSKGNIVRTETLLEAFGEHVYAKQFPESTKRERDLFAADVLRYFLLREIPFGQDGSFSFEAMITRYNADLANGFGNLVSRTLAMIRQYFDGVIPSASMDEQVSDSVHSNLAAYNSSFGKLDFSALLQNLQNIVAAADGLITAEAPWKLAKIDTERTRLSNVLYTAVEAVRIVTAAMAPILPFSTDRIFAQLGTPAAEEGTERQRYNATLGPLAPIFPRAEKGLAQIMIDMEEERSAATASAIATASGSVPAQNTSAADAGPRTASLDGPSGVLPVAGSQAVTTRAAGEPVASHAEAQASGGSATAAQAMAGAQADGPADRSPEITIDDFAKVELRVAQVVVCERIPKADKLLRLEVDLGYERRQILSGIAAWYTPEDLIGRRIVVITNLAPRRMRGLESHGMLLAASDGDGGKPVLATFGEEIALGSRLK